jgi:hypothetical protein
MRVACEQVKSLGVDASAAITKKVWLRLPDLFRRRRRL